MQRPSVMCSVVACSLCCFSTVVRANGTPETFAPDVRTLGLAHADGADDDGQALAHTNPAALARAATARISAAFALSLPQLEVTLEREPESPALAPATPGPVPGVMLAASTPLSLGGMERLAIGVSAYFPTQVLIRARAHDPLRPFFYRYDSATEHYDVSAALALSVVDWLSLGAGARLTAGQTGTIDIATDVVRGRLTRQTMDAFQYAVFAPMAGVLIGPFGVDGVVTGQLGLVWREATEFDMVFPANLAIEGAEVDARLDVVAQTNYAPRTATAAVAFDVIERLRLFVDLTYAFWSLAPPPYLRARADLSGSTLEELGLEDTLDAPGEREDRVVAPGFTDTLVFKVASEARLWSDMLWVRAGYQLRPTPVPDQTSGTNIIDARAHVFATGATVFASLPLIVSQPVGFDFGYQLQLLDRRAAQKERPNDEVGPWQAGGVVHAVALGLSYRF
jgi:long-subunit fatty acid transport protein